MTPPRPRTAVGLLLSVACLLAAGAGRAQDPVFSQYTAAAVHTNPALAGVFEGDLRVSVNYREQWTGPLERDPFRTYAAAAELRYDLGGRDYLTASTNLLHDSGGLSAFSINRAAVGLSMQKYLAGAGWGRDVTYLGFGARVGYGQHRVDAQRLWFSSGYDTLGNSIVTEGGALPLSFDGATRGYLDASTGVSLTVVKRHFSVWAGLAGHHLNRPNISFVRNAEVTLAPRYSGLIGGEYLFDADLRLLPSASVEIQGKHRRLTTGAALYYRPSLSGDAGFRLGLYGRTGARDDDADALESLIVVGQFEIPKFTFGLSYDVNLGGLAAATDGRGGYELSVSYVHGRRRGRRQVTCPKI